MKVIALSTAEIFEACFQKDDGELAKQKKELTEAGFTVLNTVEFSNDDGIFNVSINNSFLNFYKAYKGSEVFENVALGPIYQFAYTPTIHKIVQFIQRDGVILREECSIAPKRLESIAELQQYAIADFGPFKGSWADCQANLEVLVKNPAVFKPGQ